MRTTVTYNVLFRLQCDLYSDIILLFLSNTLLEARQKERFAWLNEHLNILAWDAKIFHSNNPRQFELVVSAPLGDFLTLHWQRESSHTVRETLKLIWKEGTKPQNWEPSPPDPLGTAGVIVPVGPAGEREIATVTRQLIRRFMRPHFLSPHFVCSRG